MRNLLIILFILLPSMAFSQKPEVVLSTGHHDMIYHLDISPGGRWMASASNDKIIKIWDVAATREYRTLAGNDGRVERLIIAPDEKTLGALFNSGELKIWNLITGELKASYKTESNGIGFGFFALGTKVCYVNDESQLCIASCIENSTPEKLGTATFSKLVVDTKKDMAYGMDYQGKLIYYDLAEGKKTGEFKMFEAFNFPFTRPDLNFDGTLIAAGFNDDKVHVFNLEAKTLQTTLDGYTSKLTDIKFDERSNKLITCTHDAMTKIWDVDKKEVLVEYTDQSFAAYCVESHPELDVYAQANYNVIRFSRMDDGKEFRRYEGKSNKIINIAIDQNGKYLASATGKIDIKVWDLEQNKITRVLQGFFPCVFSESGNDLISMNYSMGLAIFNIATGKVKAQLDTEKELIQNLSLSNDGRFLAGAGFLGIIKIWDLETHQLVKKLTGHVGGIYGTSFSPDGKYLASAGMDKTVKVWNLETGGIVKELAEHQILVSDVKFSPDGKYLASASWDKTIKLWNTGDWSLAKIMKGHVNSIHSICFNDLGNKLVSGAGNNSVSEKDNSIYVWDVETGEPRCHFTSHADGVNKVVFENTSDLIFSASNDGLVKIFNPGECKEVASLISVDKDDYAIITPDNYYTASKAALKGVSFRLNNELYPFEQFDLRLNRPDIVGSSIGKTPQGLLNAYEYVYNKRLKRMGFTEDELGEDFHLPTIEITSEDIPVVTSGKKLHFKVKSKDALYNLDRVNVYINDVPVFGKNGLDVSSQNSRELEKEITINLMEGNNKVQVSVMNVKGAESLAKTFDIIRQSGGESDLYIVSMGVSNYKDERFNLTYPTKDASDIVQELLGTRDIYKDIHVKKLLDEEVTVANFNSLADFLAPAGTDDVVIIFIAGHGVLDNEFNYYYGTWNMNFNYPADGGLSYEQIDELLATIKALKKLLIMDTCHSGELDTEEFEAYNSKPEEGDVEFRSAGAGLRQKEGFGVENSIELMESLFSDIRKGSGATVISSAGGAEFAMESDKWKNGLFTYCLLQGLDQKSADINNDGKIIISELRQFVYSRVTELSNGKQRPTARSENLSLDYRIY